MKLRKTLINKIKQLILTVVLFSGFLTSCALINFEQINYSTYPAQRNEIIGSADPVWIEFSLPLIETEAEKLIKVSKTLSTVQGDLEWVNNRLVFTPKSDWDRGTRYILDFIGEVETTDGREFVLHVSIPFFSVTDDPKPHLETEIPASGENALPTDALTFTFDREMDTTTSISDYFSLSPSTLFDHGWDPAGRALTIVPLGQWEANNIYSWTINQTLKDINNIPLVSTYEGNFVVQNELQPPPVIVDVLPVISSWSLDFPDTVGAVPLNGGNTFDAEWIGFRDAIRINVNNPELIDLTSLQDAFSLSPTVNGTIHRITTPTESFFVFVPDSNARYLIDTLYTLTITQKLKNIDGVQMQEDFTVWFRSNTEHLDVEQIIFEQEDIVPKTVITDFNSYTPVELDFIESISEINIRFNVPIENSEVFDLAQFISFDRFSPADISFDVVNISHSGTDLNMIISYDNTECPSEGHLYSVTIPGGPGGIVTESGNYLEKDFFLFIIVGD